MEDGSTNIYQAQAAYLQHLKKYGNTELFKQALRDFNITGADANEQIAQFLEIVAQNYEGFGSPEDAQSFRTVAENIRRLGETPFDFDSAISLLE